MYFESGRVPGPAGQHHPLASPYGRFRAADGYLNIAAGNDAMWKKLAVALGHSEWIADARFAGVLERVANRDALTAEIETVLDGADVDHWIEVINAAGVPCGPVLDIGQVFSDPQVLAREMLAQMEHPEIGVFKTTGLPVKLSRTPGGLERRPPLLGEHTDEVLRECGIDAHEIADLRQRGII
jgi:formyl-CoA transferase/CoA:oxalate CoA-transferase